MALLFNPYANRTAMAETIGQPWTVIARAASLYTDPFIMMSGLLTTYSLIGRLQKGQSIKVMQEYVGRFLRIAPPLGALILFCTYVLPLMGSGPQWNLVITHHSGICKMYWWRNLMFIHNYFGFENMVRLIIFDLFGINNKKFVFSALHTHITLELTHNCSWQHPFLPFYFGGGLRGPSGSLSQSPAFPQAPVITSHLQRISRIMSFLEQASANYSTLLTLCT